MKQPRSVGVLILATTSLLAVMLLLAFCFVAASAFERQKMAAQDSHAIQQARRLLTARQAVRLESGEVTAALVSPARADAGTRRQLLSMHASASRSLESVRADMAKDGRAAMLMSDFLLKNRLVEQSWRAALQVLALERSARPASVLDDYIHTTRQRLEVLDVRAAALSRDVARSDSFNSQMMKINDLVWRLRVDAGYDRGNITRMLQQGAPLTAAQREQFLLSDGRIDSVWELIQAEVRAGDMPAGLHAAIRAASASYFGTFRPFRQHILQDLALGRSVTLTGQDWLKRSNPGLVSITAMSDTVFGLTEAHAREELRAANARLAGSGLLMLVAVGLSGFVMRHVRRHIVGPLRKLTQILERIAAGDAHAGIPFVHRPDEIGAFARGLGLLRDSNHERRQLEAAKQAADMANRVKSEFLANMSHELRTPLNAIIGFSDMMRAQMFGALTDRYAEYAALINQSGQHLLNLVSDILDLSKVEAGKWDIAPVALDLDQTLDYCLRMVSQRAGNRGVRLAKHVPQAGTIFADERACRQVLLNLLTNAVKFSREGGEVTISAVRSGCELQITVRDNGIGIPASELPRIGNAFEQASNGAFIATEGTGLGLALVKSLLALHKGSFHIASVEGHGTTVTVGFPLQQDAVLAA